METNAAPSADLAKTFEKAQDNQPKTQINAAKPDIATKAEAERLARAEAGADFRPPGMDAPSPNRLHHLLRVLKGARDRIHRGFRRAEVWTANKGKAKEAQRTAVRPPVRAVAGDRPKKETAQERQSRDIRESYARRRLNEASKTLKKDQGRSR